MTRSKLKNLALAGLFVANIFAFSKPVYATNLPELQQFNDLIDKSLVNNLTDNNTAFTYYNYPKYLTSDKVVELVKERIALLKVTNSYQYFKTSSISITAHNSNKTIEFEIKYSAEYPTKEQELIEKIDKILAGLFSEIPSEELTDKEKVRLIHNYIIDALSFDKTLDKKLMVADALTAFNTHKAVCQGYTHLANLMFERCGIKSTIIVSKEMDHCWNKVYLDGEWYNLDITWDDKNKYTSYFYFCDKDENFIGHTWDKDYYNKILEQMTANNDIKI